MKKYFSIVIILGALAIPMVFNACGASHVESGSLVLASSDPCISKIEAGAVPVYNYVKTLQCATCHFLGTGAAPSTYYFADANIANAIAGFANVSEGNPDRFYAKIYDPGHFGGAGPQNQTALEPLRANFTAGALEFNNCIAEKNGGSGGGGNLNPTKQTIAKTIPAIPSGNTQVRNIVWDLGTEMQTAGAALPGAQFRLSVQAAVSATGIRQYYITAPNAQGATAGAIQIRNIRIYLNGTLIPLNAGGGTWTSLNNHAPVGRLHPLASGTGVMILQADTTLATNTIAVGFGTLEVSQMYPDFNPTTYARLMGGNNAPQAERVFANRCVSCHSADNTNGNLIFANNNLGLLKQTGRVVPFAPNASLIHARMSLPAGANGVMPQTGPVPAAELRFVRDWILDGAP